MDLGQLHGRLRLHFKELRTERERQPLYLIEHGLTPEELEEVTAEVKKRLHIADIATHEWTTMYLPLLVIAVEVAYEVGGGDDYWTTFDKRLNWRFSHESQRAVYDLFRSLRNLTLVTPLDIEGSPSLRFEAWPAAHAVLP